MFAVRAQQFTTPGTTAWDVPDACTGWVWFNGIGGGGAGGHGIDGVGGTTSAGGGGGGAGEVCQGKMLKVTPGGTLSITVGAGGTYTGIGARLPVQATIGAIQVGGDAENALAGSTSGGDGGLNSTVGSLRMLGGAGGLGGGTSGGHGGTGAGPKSYDPLVVGAGNQGQAFSLQRDGSNTKPSSKDSTRWSGGGGGGAGNGVSLGTPGDGGTGGNMTFNASSVAGVGQTNGTTGKDNGGAGGGGSSAYGRGSKGADGEEAAYAPAATAYGAGSGGATENRAPQAGADGYVLLVWFEKTGA